MLDHITITLAENQIILATIDYRINITVTTSTSYIDKTIEANFFEYQNKN